VRSASSLLVSEPTPQPSATPPASPVPAALAAPAAPAAPAPAPPPAAPPAAIAPPPPVAVAAVAAPAVARPSYLDPASIRPAVIIAIINAALFYGTQILNEALPAAASDVPVTAGGTVDIGSGSRITPVAGWVPSRHDNGNGIKLEKGIVIIDLFPEVVGTNAVDLAEKYRDQVLKTATTQFTATNVEAFTSTNGTQGARFRYQGIFTGIDVPIEGEVSVLFAGGPGVVADAWTRQGSLDDSLGEIHAMVQTIVVGS
jgi:hypothetical protein